MGPRCLASQPRSQGRSRRTVSSRSGFHQPFSFHLFSSFLSFSPIFVSLLIPSLTLPYLTVPHLTLPFLFSFFSSPLNNSTANSHILHHDSKVLRIEVFPNYPFVALPPPDPPPLSRSQSSIDLAFLLYRWSACNQQKVIKGTDGYNFLFLAHGETEVYFRDTGKT